jgi:hypothetical protein
MLNKIRKFRQNVLKIPDLNVWEFRPLTVARFRAHGQADKET